MLFHHVLAIIIQGLGCFYNEGMDHYRFFAWTEIGTMFHKLSLGNRSPLTFTKLIFILYTSDSRLSQADMEAALPVVLPVMLPRHLHPGHHVPAADGWRVPDQIHHGHPHLLPPLHLLVPIGWPAGAVVVPEPHSLVVCVHKTARARVIINHK
jgi:hypothetical protein